MIKQRDYITSLFEQLDGKWAYVQSTGLLAEITLESSVKLKHRVHWGLTLLSTLEWNWERDTYFDTIKKLVDPIVKVEDKKDYKLQEEIHEAFKEFINTQLVQVGRVSGYKAKNVKIGFYEEELYTIEIQNEDSVIKIRLDRDKNKKQTNGI